MAARVPLDPEGWDSALKDIAHRLSQGGVIAVPTETFFALAASVRSAPGIQRIRQIKGQPDTKPILVLVSGPEQLPELVAELPPVAHLLIERFWPGPLTLICPAVPQLPDELTAGTGTVAVRQPGMPVLCQLLEATGPVTGTSANRSGAPPACSAAEVDAALGNEVDLIVEGTTPGTLPSTLLDLTGPVRLLREGPISRTQVADALRSVGLTLETPRPPEHA